MWWGEFVGDSETCETSCKRTALSLVTISLSSAQVRGTQRLWWVEETERRASHFGDEKGSRQGELAGGRVEARGSWQLGD